MPPRRKKSPNVYPLANGRWQARLWRGGQLHKVTFDTRAEAEQYRDAIDLDWRLRSRGLAGIVRRRPALLDLIASFLEAAESRELAPATLDYYRFTLAGWEKFVSEVLRRPALAAADVDDRLIARYAAWRLSRPLSDHAHRPPSEVQIAKDLTSLRAVFRHGGETVRWHPPRRLRRRGDGKRVISPEERGRWLAAMPVGSLERTYAELLANTGMRPSDAAALRRDQIDREACVIRFRAQKTGREQAVPISASLQRHLEAWLRAAPEGPDGRLFHLDGRALTRTSLRARFRRASREAGIEPPIEYAGLTRNAAIAHLLAAGESAYLVAKLVGHADLRTTMAYARAAQPVEELRGLTDRLGTQPETGGANGESD